jgi:hypothetical protein
MMAASSALAASLSQEAADVAQHLHDDHTGEHADETVCVVRVAMLRCCGMSCIVRMPCFEYIACRLIVCSSIYLP